MDGDLSPEEFNLAMEYNFKAAAEIHEIMVDALKRRYEEVKTDGRIGSYSSSSRTRTPSWRRTTYDAVDSGKGAMSVWKLIAFTMLKVQPKSFWVNHRLCWS